MAIPSQMRRAVASRAGDSCEYCGLSQAGQEAAFHVDHIIPVAANGATTLDNLALACVSCSLRKGAREFITDPLTGETCRVFHPRLDVWSEHFEWQGTRLDGRTATGRATVEALKLNRPLVLVIREEEGHWGRHPPKGF